MLVILMLALGSLPAHAWSNMGESQNSVPSSAIDLEDASEMKSAPPTVIQVKGKTYTRGKRLGRGNSGQVYELELQGAAPEFNSFAGKFIASTPEHDQFFGQDVRREITLQKKCQGKNIVAILGDTTLAKSTQTSYGVAATFTVIVMELLRGGDLHSHLERGRGLDPKLDIGDTFIQIVEGLKHMHHKGVAHLDLHPGNIFLDTIEPTGTRTIIKIGDFGSAAGIGWHTRSRGQIGVQSPEVSTGRYRGDRVDVWSLGLVLYEMLGGVAGEQGVGSLFPLLFPDGAAEDLKKLVAKMLEPEPERRIKLDEVCEKLRVKSENPSFWARLTQRPPATRKGLRGARL